MRASELMETVVICTKPSSTIKQAADLMLKHRVSALPVVDPRDHVIGLLSEGDLIRRGELGSERFGVLR
ncbi:MAG: histidine kinase [Rhodospirillales bacterium]|nr:histidine kinase [Rhodospirillales bacterium]